MRGNHIRRRSPEYLIGSIPARAGEPSTWCTGRSRCRVYPRACGGTPFKGSNHIRVEGLSPRVRGNQPEPVGNHVIIGSIPARAGEPLTGAIKMIGQWVYPRACGGTATWPATYRPWVGLSPRVRGNRTVAANAGRVVGSIPARAGEPTRRERRRRTWRVYPRACGGTIDASELPTIGIGLSPRVRGNRNGSGDSVMAKRSIPARAGEPLTGAIKMIGSWVYPRACGGTYQSSARLEDEDGLSPRVRGNLARNLRVHVVFRSIPARAGEPVSVPTRIGRRWVYPRACGGTASYDHIDLERKGLSPRVRGNPAKGSEHPYG